MSDVLEGEGTSRMNSWQAVDILGWRIRETCSGGFREKRRQAFFSYLLLPWRPPPCPR